MNLTGTTWFINEFPDVSHVNVKISFTSNGQDYIALDSVSYSYTDYGLIYYAQESSDIVYSNNEWFDFGYRTITFTSEVDEESSTLDQEQFIIWLEANATSALPKISKIRLPDGVEYSISDETPKNYITKVNASWADPIDVNCATYSGVVNLDIYHSASGVISGSYGSSTAIPVITVNDTGHITDISTSTVNSSTKFTTCTLPIFSAAGSQAVTVSGVTANSHPVLDVYIDTAAHATAYTEAWSHIYKADTSANTITFYSDAATSTALTVMVKDY